MSPKRARLERRIARALAGAARAESGTGPGLDERSLLALYGLLGFFGLLAYLAATRRPR